MSKRRLSVLRLDLDPLDFMVFSLFGLRYRLCLIASLIFGLGAVGANPTLDQDKVLAAMALRVTQFVEYPDDVGEVFAFGVFADRQLFTVLQAILAEGGQFSNYRAVYLDERSSVEQLRSLDALLFGNVDISKVSYVVSRLSTRPILLMGASGGFLESGGMVNFIKRNKRVAFEINARQAARHRIEFRAQLLRLAVRVID
ncbi:MAG: YfiR family protein [Verrucomicrobiota bacterium]